MAKEMEQFEQSYEKLKAFEKWWDKNKGWLECIDSPANYDARITAKIVWKAALEWALSHKKPIKYKDYKFDYIKTDVIKEELGNE